MPEYESSPFDRQFERLVHLQEGEEAEELFTELLKHGSAIIDPLHAYLLRFPDEPDTAILVVLAAKTMEIQAISILMQLVTSPVPEIRRAAAYGLGWNRSAAALPILDEMEGTDTDELVAMEARAAIEEILQGHPGKAKDLTYHQPVEPSPRAGDNGPALPSREKRRLMAAMPRLLALQYKTLPLEFTDEGILIAATEAGSERWAGEALPPITGCQIRLEPWEEEPLVHAINEFYHFGDDDFCSFHEEMTCEALQEVVELIAGAVRAQEPSCPLDEASDAVEAVQGFLSSCGALGVVEAMIDYMPPTMALGLHDGAGRAVYAGIPPEEIRLRFLEVLRLMATKANGEAGERFEGAILCEESVPPFAVHYQESRTGDVRKIRLKFDYPAR